MNNFNSIIAPLVEEASMLPIWAQSPLDPESIIDRLLVNADSRREFFGSVYKSEPDLSMAVSELAFRLNDITHMKSPPLRLLDKAREFVTGMPRKSILEDALKEFSVIANDFDKLVDSSVNKLAQDEQLIMWIEVLFLELEERKLDDTEYLSAMLAMTLQSLRNILRIDQVIFDGFFRLEQSIAFAKAHVNQLVAMERYERAKLRAIR